MFRRLLSIAALCAAAFAQQQAGEKLAPYYPTPETIVAQMLDLGQLKAGEKMFDLGSGDGRIVIMAARQYHADATGGQFFRAAEVGTVESAFHAIDQSQKIEFQARNFVPTTELFPWLAAPALTFWAIGALLLLL